MNNSNRFTVEQLEDSLAFADKFADPAYAIIAITKGYTLEHAEKAGLLKG